MIEFAYPWKWLVDNVAPTFILRFPWVDAVSQATRDSQAVCLIIPEAAGSLSLWERWLVDRLDEAGGVRAFLHDTADFRELVYELGERYAFEQGPTGETPAGWSRRILAECRREVPHAETLPLVVTGADDACAAALGDLVLAQRDIGYPFARPILLRRGAPPGWDGEVIRFGLPEWVGDLNRIVPVPEQDLDFWTNVLLALTVAWEAAAVPRLAQELWDILQLQRTVPLRNTHAFDAWLDRELNDFARRHGAALEYPLPTPLAFGPMLQLKEEGPWHRGAVAWEGDGFDVTPLQARLWAIDLDADARASLRRRRLTNLPLARWLSAWAASIEESLRVAVLQASSARFRNFLETRPPWHLSSSFRSRLHELGLQGDEEVVDRAQFGDLTAFLATNPSRSARPIPSQLLESCRVARNRVVHQRLVTTQDFLAITNLACWLHASVA